MNIYGKYYPWFGAAIFIAIVLAVAYYIGTRTGKAKSESKEEDVLNKAIQKGELSFDQTTFVSLADKLENSMYGYGDDEETIYSVFTKLRTKSDVLQLIKTFGNRRIIFTIGSSNLNQWLNNRLDVSELAKVNDILSRNSIDYQF